MGQNENNLVRKDVDLLISYMKNADVNLVYIPVWGHTGIMFSKTAEPFHRIIDNIKKDMRL